MDNNSVELPDLNRKDIPKTTETPPPKKATSNFSSSMGNFSAQYNLSCGAIALLFIQAGASGNTTASDSPGENTYFVATWIDYTLLGLVFAGAVVGMTFMGYLGDLFGRRRAMMLALSFTILGSQGAALFPWGNLNELYGVLCGCRFVLGIGIGGIYPLSSSKSAELSTDPDASRAKVAWGYFWQIPGSIFPYIVALLLTLIPYHKWVSSFQFRFILGLGGIPSMIALLDEIFWRQEGEEFQQRRRLISEKQGNSSVSLGTRPKISIWHEMKTHPQYFKLLLGSAGSWFCYDFSHYGIAIFTPQIIGTIYGQSDIYALCWQSLIVAALGLPGALLGLKLLKPVGIRWLIIYNFFLLAVFELILAVSYQKNPHDKQSFKFGIICIISFLINSGANIGTFVLPAATYPIEVRSTFSGLCAAIAKIGAVLGTFLYQPLASRFSMHAVFWLHCSMSILGLLLGYFFVPNTYLGDAQARDALNALKAKDSTSETASSTDAFITNKTVEEEAGPTQPTILHIRNEGTERLRG